MTKTSLIQLSTKGLLAADQLSRHDFKFVSGSDCFTCDRFQAAYLSPHVFAALLTDPTVDAFPLKCSDSKSFDVIAHLVRGEAVPIGQENLETLQNLAENLGNPELSERVINFLNNFDELTLANCVTRLSFRVHLGLKIADEVIFVASHFCDLNSNDLNLVSIEALAEILFSDALHIDSEDYLLDWILDHGEDYHCLLSAVRLTFLQQQSIDRLFTTISPLICDHQLWQNIWSRVRHQIVLDETDMTSSRRTEKIIKKYDDPWSGLIRELSLTCGGNVHTKQVVECTCSGTGCGKCSQVVDCNQSGYWQSLDSPNSWIQCDFKIRKVSLTHYSLKSSGSTVQFLQQWEITGSNDAQT
jgi:hypothetical protein